MKAVLLLVIACLAVSCYAITDAEMQKLFSHWTAKHGKTYAAAEFQARFEIFKSNAEFVDKHNSKANISFTVALNKFADLTAKEFAAIYNGLKVKSLPVKSEEVISTPQLPSSVDWRTKGAVTPIKNQGQCGSCWSFSTTGSTEGAHFLQAKKPLVGLSEQNLMDCSTAEGNNGCNGGLMDDAFRYIIANHGVDTERSYPYTAADGTCRFNPANVGATLVSYQDVPSQSEPALTQAISERGPISVAIDAGENSFQLYNGGVYYEPACSPTALDHGVLAVGYGASGSQDYYIVKNSWGSDWGMNGYIWMSRNRNNNCGIATMASYPCAVGACVPQ